MAKACILVVEDEWMIAAQVEHILQHLGYEVLGPASNLKAALALLEHRRPDVALLDIHLGRETSYPVADELRQGGVPFAFVTAFYRSDLPDRFSRSEIMSKPFSERALQSLVERTLRQD